ncbi:MAG: hypothetical protein IPO93_06460 [Actinobacteria bacterium]|jgi:hypothetical protein|nr:hypothetical protein [Actinomycetota bacterium]
MTVLPTRSPTSSPTKPAIDFLASSLGGDGVRLITLDTRNPNGGRGGSIDSDQCAWLVREPAASPRRGVVIATRHRSSELRNALSTLDLPPRILADELVPILLAHPNVLGWIGGHRHRPGAIRHGARDTGLWEMTPALLGFGCHAWLGLQSRRGIRFATRR